MASITTRQRQRSVKGRRRQRQRRQARKARAARRRLAQLHDRLPRPARDLLDAFAPAFTRPTFLRFVVLCLAAILTLGGRTVCNLLRTLGALAPGHPASYHHVFSRRRCSPWRWARALATWVVSRWLPDGPIPLAGDDTVAEHRGRQVYGKGRHRDPVRSSHSYTAFRWGHQWVVLAVLVRFPFATRPWALPLLVALYRPKGDPPRRHKTPPQLLRQLLCVLLRWFPDRRFLASADGNYGTHEVARLAARYRRRLSYVSHFYADANLYEPPPPYQGRGRPRRKGRKVPTPAQAVAAARRRRLKVAWYGGGRREVAVVTGTGQWYKAGQGLVPVRWVFVHDETGTHRDEYFFTTDVTMSAAAVIETYTGRWNIETTFEEMRAYLGLETTRGRSRRTVLRSEPGLFGLYSVVALLYAQLPPRAARARAVDWPGKSGVTFSDAITAVRRWLWQEWVLAAPGYREAFAKLALPLRRVLLSALAPAA